MTKASQNNGFLQCRAFFGVWHSCFCWLVRPAMALGPSWRFWALIAPCLLYFSWVSAVCLYFLSLASVCLWEWTERWFMGKINMCWLTESSPCFLRVLGLVNLFVCCLQTTSGVCLHCKQSACDEAWKTTSQESPRWQENQTAVCHHEPPESQTLHTKSC